MLEAQNMMDVRIESEKNGCVMVELLSKAELGIHFFAESLFYPQSDGQGKDTKTNI